MGIARVGSFLLVLGVVLGVARAQEASAPPAPAVDNLVHVEGYETCALGTLGGVVERGDGPIDMVLVSGFGVGASAFEAFMERNKARYHMLAITLPGFEGTAAPPMPAAGTSYGAQTWTSAAIDAVVKLIEARKLDRPVLVGHFLNGTQIAARIALDHPDRVRALVLLAGAPRFEPLEATPSAPKDLDLQQKVAFVDRGLAPRWFKTVSRQTWVAGNFVAGDYSVDPARGKRFADLANTPPLPVLIRYLCEFHASDVRADFGKLKQPLLVVQPTFTEAVRKDEKRGYLASFLEEPWRGVLDGREHTTVVKLEDAGFLVMDDKPDEVDAAIATFLKGG